MRYTRNNESDPLWFIEAKEQNRIWYLHKRTFHGKQHVYSKPLAHFWNAGPFTDDEWGLIQGCLISHTDSHVVVLGEDGHIWSMPPKEFNTEYEIVN